MNKYGVYPFLIINFEDKDVVIQNIKNLVILKDPNMVIFFNYLDEYNMQNIDMDILIRHFGDRAEDAVSFMLNNQLIFTRKNITVLYKNVNIFTNSKLVCDSFMFNLEGNNKKTNIMHIDIRDMILYDYKLLKDDLNIFILIPFNYRMMTDMVKILKEKNMLCQFVFYYNNFFYISNYYKSEYANPCPCCFYSKIESELRAESQMGINSFQTIMDLIYSKTPLFETNTILRPNDLLVLLNMINKQISKFNETLLKLVYALDISSSKVTVDTAIHWELCDCND